MFLRSQSILYFNVIAYIWLMGYQNGNHIKTDLTQVRILREVNFSKCLFLSAVVLTALCGCRSGPLSQMYAIALKVFDLLIEDSTVSSL